MDKNEKLVAYVAAGAGLVLLLALLMKSGGVSSSVYSGTPVGLLASPEAANAANANYPVSSTGDAGNAGGGGGIDLGGLFFNLLNPPAPTPYDVSGPTFNYSTPGGSAGVGSGQWGSADGSTGPCNCPGSGTQSYGSAQDQAAGLGPLVSQAQSNANAWYLLQAWARDNVQPLFSPPIL